MNPGIAEEKQTGTANAPKLLSFVVPCYNQEGLIAETLRSLNCIATEHRGQVEVIVVDDGSQDNSLAIINDYIQSENTGHAWRVIHKENGGVSTARNAAIDAATGEWIAFLDGDDLLAADPVPYLQQHALASCLVFSIERFGGSSSRQRLHPPLARSRRELLDCLTAASPFFTNSLVFKRNCLDKPFDASLRYLEDWKFWFDNPRIFDAMASVDQVISLYRVHDSNRTSDFAKTGVSRRQVAQYFLESGLHDLTTKQRNNAKIQDAIGAILEGSATPWGTFLALPCSPVLMAKFFVYFVMRGNISWIHPFG
ncbi:glycosyltransferase [bacterium]|nr:glycosyltransferase [bacterium]